MPLADLTTKLPDDTLERTLTPHMELAEKAIAQMLATLSGRLAQNGPAGAEARILKAFNEAFARAWAHECDLGAPPGELAALMAAAIGQVICSLALQVTFDRPPPVRAALALTLSRVARASAVKTASLSDNLGAHEYSGMQAMMPRVYRA